MEDDDDVEIIETKVLMEKFDFINTQLMVEKSEIIETELMVEKCETYACAECNYDTLFPFALEAHYKLNHMHKDRLFCCTTASLEEHKCKECHYSTVNLVNFIHHRKMLHSLEKESASYIDEEVDVVKFTEILCDVTSVSFQSYGEKFITSRSYYMGDHNYISNYCVKASIPDVQTKRRSDRKYYIFTVLIYRCHKCEYLSNKKSDMESHISLNHGSNELAAWLHWDETKESCKNPKTIRNKKSTSQLTGFRCTECDYHCNRIGDLKKHKLKHDKNRSALHCSLCFFRTTNSAEMVSHKLHFCNYRGNHQRKTKLPALDITSDNVYKEPTQSYYCNKCNYQTRTLQSLRSHITKVHTNHLVKKNLPIFNANDDEARSLDERLTYSSINPREDNFEELDSTNGKDTELRCEFCSFTTHKQGLLTVHSRRFCKRAIDLAMYQCKKCSFKTPTMQEYLDHMQRKHSMYLSRKGKGVGFPCKLCRFVGATAWCLKRHTYLVHTANELIKWFHCDMCNFKSKQKSNLNQHKLCKHEAVIVD